MSEQEESNPPPTEERTTAEDQGPLSGETKAPVRLSEQVPLGLLFLAAATAVLLFLAIVGAGAYLLMSP